MAILTKEKRREAEVGRRGGNKRDPCKHTQIKEPT